MEVVENRRIGKRCVEFDVHQLGRYHQILWNSLSFKERHQVSGLHELHLSMRMRVGQLDGTFEFELAVFERGEKHLDFLHESQGRTGLE